MKRKIFKHLNKWKNDPARKVLLLRGARQVGKTYIVRELGRGFENYVEINFYETPEIAKFFATDLTPERIISNLQAYFQIKIIPGKTLLFFDEIQECPEAITALRFFYEKLPELHVIAAGSLLEFALLKTKSFGVGRITSLFMYPLTISEFISEVYGEPLDVLVEDAISNNASINEVLHARLVEALTVYSIIGGLPEVVLRYIETKDINQCIEILSSLLISYQDDFAKYREKLDPQKLIDSLRSVAQQAGRKFVVSRINPEGSSYGYDAALQLLELAGLVYRVSRTASNGIPLGAEVDHKKNKYIPFDVGIYNRLLDLDIRQLILDQNILLVNSGSLAEVICGLEILSGSSPLKRGDLYYWSREERGSHAEIDYVVQQKNRIVPIEVKSGTKGTMQSMYLFMGAKQLRFGIRTSLENFSTFNAPRDLGEVRVIPIYAVGRLRTDAHGED